MTDRAVGEVGPYLAKSVRVKKGPRPMNKVNRERQAKMEERNFGDHGAWIRLRRCVVDEHAHPTRKIPCMGRIVACHLVPRGMGGCNGDRFSLFPACELHHSEQEGKTAEFQEAYDLDLAMLVEVYNLQDPGLSEEEHDAAQRRLDVLRLPR
jgi:hypothetical protein